MDSVTPKPREAAPRAAAHAASGTASHGSVPGSAVPGSLAESLNQSPRVRQLHQLSRILQRKRVRPAEGKPLEEYTKVEPVYNDALRKGTGYLAALAKRRAELVEGEKPPAIVEKQYNEAYNLHYNFDTTMSPEEDEEHGGVVYEMTTRHKTDETNSYHNNIVLPQGTIIADNNQAGKNKYPPANSEVLWTQDSMALAHYKANFAARHGAATLAQISREAISNDETKAVIWMVYDDDEQANKTVTPNTNDGKALLGTPNGKSSVWLLHDNMEDVGGKTIQSIDLEQGEDGQDMKINIG